MGLSLVRRHQHVAPSQLPLLGGDGPVLAAQRSDCQLQGEATRRVADAGMSGSPAAVSIASHASPGSARSPLPASHSVLGAHAQPDHHDVGGHTLPIRELDRLDGDRRRPARRPRFRGEVRRHFERCRSARHWPSSDPSGSISNSAMSISVTSRPSVRAVWATSQPMEPAPTIATRGRRSNAARSAGASSTFRNTWTPSSAPPAPGQRRGRDPVARISRSWRPRHHRRARPAGAPDPGERPARQPSLRLERATRGRHPIKRVLAG